MRIEQTDPDIERFRRKIRNDRAWCEHQQRLKDAVQQPPYRLYAYDEKTNTCVIVKGAAA